MSQELDDTQKIEIVLPELAPLEVALAHAGINADTAKIEKGKIEGALETMNPDWVKAKKALTEANKALAKAEDDYKSALATHYRLTGELPETTYATLDGNDVTVIDESEDMAVLKLVTTLGVYSAPFLTIKKGAPTPDVLAQASITHHIEKHVNTRLHRTLLAELVKSK